jgi:hypothetical protein
MAETAATFAVDPSLYPRTYRIASGPQACLVGGGGLLALAGIAALGTVIASHAAREAWASAVLAGLSLLAVLLGALVIARAIAFAVIVHPDAIEIVGLRSSRRLRREEIRGFRLRRGDDYPTLFLIPGDGGKEVRLSYILARDAAFDAWIAGLADLDQTERRESEAAVAADPRFGATAAERLRRLSAARALSIWLNLATLAILFWAWRYPRPYPLVVAILFVLPWVALLAVVTKRGLCSIGETDNGASLSLAFPFLAPGFLLFSRAITDLTAVDWPPALPVALGAGIAVAVTVALVDPGLRRKWWYAPLVAVVMSAYGYGAILEAYALVTYR